MIIYRFQGILTFFGLIWHSHKPHEGGLNHHFVNEEIDLERWRKLRFNSCKKTKMKFIKTQVYWLQT